ncbi:MAG: sensor domain-containing diguanylate cyclase [Gammaproteobacteria bacterium]|nr:sensor domain-containing diguanylate cyclase [Gammaproteobacteria bacterium]
MTIDLTTLGGRMFVEHPAAQLVIDAETGGIVEANLAAAAFFGCARERLCRMKLDELLVEPAGEVKTPAGMLASRQRWSMMTRRITGGTGPRPVETEAGLLDDGGGRKLVCMVLRDATEHRRCEVALRNYEEIIENLPIPFYRATPGATGRFLRFNPAFMRLFDADSPDQLLDLDISSLYVESHERGRFSDRLMNDGKVYRHELKLRTLTGRVISTVDTSYQHHDEEGNRVFDGVLEDITRQRELERELEYLARHDELTGLPNRRYCDEIQDAEIARSDRYGQPFSVLMLDLDNFKDINDEFGHAAGDRVLEQVAATTRSHVRKTDVAARWGGEEFVVLLPSTREQDALKLAEKLRRTIEEPGAADAPAITVSIGCGEYARGEGKDAFLSRLDAALYAAKHAGRNRVKSVEAAAPGAPPPAG